MPKLDLQIEVLREYNKDQKMIFGDKSHLQKVAVNDHKFLDLFMKFEEDD